MRRSTVLSLPPQLVSPRQALQLNLLYRQRRGKSFITPIPVRRLVLASCEASSDKSKCRI